jgi:hypothetical protein
MDKKALAGSLVRMILSGLLFVEISHGHKSVVIAVELIAHIDGRW